jgi:hypothetical protein
VLLRVETRLVSTSEGDYVECLSVIAGADDALELVAACAGAETNRVLIDAARLPDAFFDLSSRFAGEFLQKLQNYRIVAAAVLPPDERHTESFKEFLTEARRGRQFRAFIERAEAEMWLCSSTSTTKGDG